MKVFWLFNRPLERGRPNTAQLHMRSYKVENFKELELEVYLKADNNQTTLALAIILLIFISDLYRHTGILTGRKRPNIDVSRILTWLPLLLYMYRYVEAESTLPRWSTIPL